METEDEKPATVSVETLRDSSGRVEDPPCGGVRIKPEPVEEEIPFSSACRPSVREQVAGNEARVASDMSSHVKQARTGRREKHLQLEEKERGKEEAELDVSFVAMRGEDFVVKVDPDFYGAEAGEADVCDDDLHDDTASISANDTSVQSSMHASKQSSVEHMQILVKRECEHVDNCDPCRVESPGEQSTGMLSAHGQTPSFTSAQNSSDLANGNRSGILLVDALSRNPSMVAVTRQEQILPCVSGQNGSDLASAYGPEGSVQQRGVQVPGQILLVGNVPPLPVAREFRKKTYLCEACDKEVRTTEALEAHIRGVHLDCICHDCNLFFPQANLRNVHVDITHKGKSCKDNLVYLRAMKLQPWPSQELTNEKTDTRRHRSRSIFKSRDLQDEEVAKLIQLYQSQENLYDHSMKAYYDREMARKSLEYISKEMGKTWDKEQMKAKLKSLRTQYTKHLTKIRQTEDSGTSTDSVYKPSWKFFNSLDAFLRPNCTTRKGVSNMTDQADQTEGAQDIHLLLSQTQSPQSAAACDYLTADEESTQSPLSPVLTAELPRQASNKRKTDVSSQYLALLREMADSKAKKYRKEKSTDDVFGEYIALQLKELPPEKRGPARKRMQEVLWDFQNIGSS